MRAIGDVKSAVEAHRLDTTFLAAGFVEGIGEGYGLVVDLVGKMRWQQSDRQRDRRLDLHAEFFSKVDGLSSDQKLNLNLRQRLTWGTYRPQEVWENVYAERCTSGQKCESASQARIWLEKGNPNDKRVSGKYEVDFGALHLAGQFVAKYRKDKNWICE